MQMHACRAGACMTSAYVRTSICARGMAMEFEVVDHQDYDSFRHSSLPNLQSSPPPQKHAAG